MDSSTASLRDLTYTGGVLGQDRHGSRIQNACPNAPQRYKYGAVHEHMTAFAVANHRRTQHWQTEPDRPGVFRYLVEPRWPKGANRTHRTKDIIFGTWWNDDPLMLMWGQGMDLVYGVRRIEKFFKPSARYPGSLRDLNVDAKHSNRTERTAGIPRERSETLSGQHRLTVSPCSHVVGLAGRVRRSPQSATDRLAGTPSSTPKKTRSSHEKDETGLRSESK